MDVAVGGPQLHIATESQLDRVGRFGDADDEVTVLLADHDELVVDLRTVSEWNGKLSLHLASVRKANLETSCLARTNNGAPQKTFLRIEVGGRGNRSCDGRVSHVTSECCCRCHAW